MQPWSDLLAFGAASVKNAAGSLPSPLHAVGPRGLLWWQWLALLILAALAWALAMPAARLTVTVASRIASRTRTRVDGALLSRLPGPLRLAWTLLFVEMGLPLLELTPAAQRTVETWLGSLAVAAAFWALLRSADVFFAIVSGSGWAQTNRISRALLPLALRAGKVVIFFMAIVAVLSAWGFPVASLLAGLGVGGIALALAAQKTVENLFGSFSIGVDQPFREGDAVNVEGISGTVELIGLRSTRVRTLDRTLVTIPNGKLADMKIENIAPRDRIRFNTTLTLPHDVTASQVRAVLTGLEGRLRAAPKLLPESVAVRFKEITPAALGIEVNGLFDTADWGEFMAIRQELLLGFLEIVEAAGTRLAAPTSIVRLDRLHEAVRGPASPPPEPAGPSPALG